MAQGKKKKKKEEATSRKSKEKKNYNKNQTLIKTRIEKKKKKKQRTEALMQVAHGHFCHLAIRFPPTKFSPHFAEKNFWWVLEENNRALPSFFPLFLPIKHIPKSFPSFFVVVVVVVVKSTLPNTPLLQVGWKMELGMEPCTGLRPPKV